jgi:hypothetical protein
MARRERAALLPRGERYPAMREFYHDRDAGLARPALQVKG